jgi:triacylglycerol esterase/lipase EstA (alpha/beta hydrolase family)
VKTTLLFGLILLGAAAILFLVLATNVIFWVQAARSSQLAQLHRLAAGKLWSWALKGFFSSLFSIVLLVVFYPLGLLRKRLQIERNIGNRPVIIILVHGLYQNEGSWFLFKRRLKRAGFRNIYAVGYNSFNTSFFEILDLLQTQINQIRVQVPTGKFILIGHSLGGLFCRAYSDRASAADNIAGVITLGTPHGGTKLAILGTGRLARSLNYHGDLIDKIDQGASSSFIPRIALYSPIDNIVIPQTALLPRSPGWACYMTAPIGHAAMLFHRPTFGEVLTHIRSIVEEAMPYTRDGKCSKHLT